jgi:malonyl CoA-acyl carrier protein transacylase
VQAGSSPVPHADAPTGSPADAAGSPVPCAVAIIGMGGCFPGANSVAEYWKNICAKHVAIGPVPADRWDSSLYYSADRTAAEKTYSCLGGFMQATAFEARQFRIPPRTAAAIDDLQKIALLAVHHALTDAGLQTFGREEPGRAFNRDRCAVILGNSMGGEAEDLTSLRVWFTQVRAELEASLRTTDLTPQRQAELLDGIEARVKARLPTITEDSMPGEISNCITGRIANAFDLRGPNFTTDAACAASMAALQTAVSGLTHGDYDLALAGGADRSMDPPTYVKFSKIGALSATMSAPFDARADGFVMGEGVGVLVLKRLADALRDQDRVYAVIRGVGAASDGRGKGITAPNPRGQRLAMQRAYAQAGCSISSVGLFEAHGTSTKVGDATELQVLSDLLAEAGAGRCAIPIGSVKSMIGHLKSAAGAAAVIKASLALHHRRLPPSANFVSPPAQSPLHDGYLRVVTQDGPWEPGAGPRRAGVSAFGFGGTNFHLVLEEFAPQSAALHPQDTAYVSTSKTAAPASSVAAAPTGDLTAAVVALFAEKTGYDLAELQLDHQLEADLGIDTVKQAEILAALRGRYGIPEDSAYSLSQTPTLRSVAEYLGAHLQRQGAGVASDGSVAAASAGSDVPEVLVFGGSTPQAALEAAQQALRSCEGVAGAQSTQQQQSGTAAPGSPTTHLQRNGQSGTAAPQSPSTLLQQSSQSGTPAPGALPAQLLQGRHSAAQMPCRLAFYASDIEEVRRKVADAGRRSSKMLAAQGVFVSEGAPLAQRGKVAFLFPGQGSQYLGMLRDLSAQHGVVKETFAQADRALRDLMPGKQALSEVVWGQTDDEAAEELLRDTRNCQPAMLTADVAMLRLLGQYGVKADLVAGHSLGEYAATVAAGIMTFEEALYAVSARGREMADVQVPDCGKMAMVASTADRVQAVLDALNAGYVIAANKNCHTQTVIAGESHAVDAAMAAFATAGIEARRIPVSHAFHCKIVAPAAQPMRRVLQGLDIRAPRIPLVSNVTADYYPDSKAGVIDLLARQLASPVEFIGQIEKLYADGARIFVEVGPRRAITGFVRNILGDREHRAWATNHHKKTGTQGVAEVLAALASDGLHIDFGHKGSRLQDSGAQPGAGAAAAAPAARTGDEAPAALHSAPCAHMAAQTVVSGMAVVLPQERPVLPLGEDPYADLMRGQNYIQTIPVEERRGMLDRNVTRLNKGQGTFTPLREVGEVIQLVARFGELDLPGNYGIDNGLAEAMDGTGRLAVAAGIDALRDAGIPLIQRYRTTSTGSRLADRWALPESLAGGTGVIMASAYPAVDCLLDEAAKYAAAQGARRSAQELETFVETWAQTLRDPEEGRRLREAYAAQAQALRQEAQAYQFHRKWLLRTLSLGHAQLAQAVLAQGPNTQINAACASGPQAVAIAHDWLRLGRCDRVVVVTVDNVTGPASLAWFGAGFLAAGAATVEPQVEKAAVPFGAERNGMILGAGAAAFVIERDAAVQARGMVPLVDVVAARFGNSAFHATRLDSPYICKFVETLLGDVDAALGKPRAQWAPRAFFMSHETYTPARGGSAAAEVEALRHSFGSSLPQVLVANTKGYTGHPMGATVEDAVAIKGLQRQQLPPVANLHNVDSQFTDLKFARGGAIDADIALRFGAGFGSQVAMVAYRRRATSEARLTDAAAYQRFLDSLCGRPGATLELGHRTLRLCTQGVAGAAAGHLAQDLTALQIPSLCPVTATPAVQGANSALPAAAASTAQVTQELIALFAEHTGYEPSEFAPEHLLESDLGIDTVKQAELMALIQQKYELGAAKQFNLSDLQSIGAIADYVTAQVAASGLGAPDQPPSAGVQEAAAPATASAPHAASATHAASAPHAASATHAASAPHAASATHIASAPDAAPAINPASTSLSKTELLAQIRQLFANHTGYDLDELDPAHALEADLGIDTVKQAELLAVVRERYGLSAELRFNLSEMQTLTQVAEAVFAALPSPSGNATGAATAANAATAAPVNKAAAPLPGTTALQADAQTLLQDVVSLFAEHTGYDPAELDPSHALEADLGIDTVKQAELLSLLRERFKINAAHVFKLTELHTLNHVVQALAAAMPTTSTESSVVSVPRAAASDQTAASDQAAKSSQADARSQTNSPSQPAETRQVEALAAPLERGPAPVSEPNADDTSAGAAAPASGPSADHASAGAAASASGPSADHASAGAAASASGPSADHASAGAAAPLAESDTDPATAAFTAAAARGFHVRPTHWTSASLEDENLTGHWGGCQVQLVGNVQAPGLAADLAELLTRAGARLSTVSPAAEPEVKAGAHGQQATDSGAPPVDEAAQMSPRRCIYVVSPVDARPEAVQAATQQIFAAAQSFSRGCTAAAPGQFWVVGASPQTATGESLVLGASMGLCKSLQMEAENLTCGVCNVAGEPAVQAAFRVMQGLGHLQAASRLQVLQWHDAAWWTLRPGAALKELQPVPLQPGSVVLATGGARGVTHQLLLALCATAPVQLFICGRTAGEPPEKSPLHGLSAAEHKDLARQALKEADTAATPVAIRQWLAKAQARQEIYANLQALRDLGATVHFSRCDVSDPAALSAFIAQAKAHSGHIDLVLHGAGIEESRPLRDKDPQAFARTFAPKAAAALQLLAEAAPKRLVTMGSIAGFFGNAGQTDYAAANALMATVARQHGAVLNLGWTAWKEVGMATRGSITQVLEKLGIALMPSSTGVALGAALICSELTGDTVIAGALGVLEHQEEVHQQTSADALPEAVEPPAETQDTFFTATEPSEWDGSDATTFTRVLDVQQDTGLQDHRIEGTAVLPGVLGMEMLLQAATRVLGEPVRHLHSVKFASPVKLFHDAPTTVQVQVQRLSEGGLRLQLQSLFVAATGRQVWRQNFTAAVAAQTPPWPTDPVPSLEMPCEPSMGRDDIYKRYFHGPSFQVIEQVQTLGENGADGVPVPLGGDWLAGLPQPQSLSQPLLCEAALQVAGLWEMVECGRLSLPAGIESIWFGPPAAPSALQLQARRRSVDAKGCLFDVTCSDATGRLHMAMRGSRSIVWRDLTAAERFEPPQRNRPPRSMLLVPLSEAQALLDDPTAQALQHYLSAPERRRFAEFTLPKRRLDWFAARLAAKRLIREACFGREHAIVPYNAITVDRDELGAPVVQVVGDRGPLPRLSLSHSHGVAAAFLTTDANLRPGIDVEHIEARDHSFAKTYFTATEIAWTEAQKRPDEALTQLWAIKEATLKALGIGARVDFREVEISPRPQPGSPDMQALCWDIVLHAEAHRLAHHLDVGSAQVEVETTPERVIARVLLPLRRSDRRSKLSAKGAPDHGQ